MRAIAMVNARVRTMTDGGGGAESIAFRGDRIVAVGRRAEVLAAAGDGADIVDVAQATVLPGFVDAHHHVSLSALYGGLVRLTPPRVTDIASLQAALAEAAAPLAPGRWLVAMEWDEGQLAERRSPTREELDDAVPNRPLLALHYTCHRGVANSRALELARLDQHTPDPSGGLIERDRRGRPSGLLIERGLSRVEALARRDLAEHDAEGFLSRMADHYRRLVAAGITRVCDTTVPPELISLYREAASRGEVLVPTTLCPVSTTGYLESPWDVLDGPVTGHKEGPLTIGPVKLVFDGAPGCAMCLSLWQCVGVMARTVALAARMRSIDPIRTSMSTQPRVGGAALGGPGGATMGRRPALRTGISIYGRDEATAIVAAIVERGFGVATHAIGNDAADNAIAAYEAAGRALHGAATPRIEHGAFLDRALVRRIADLGVTVVAQPAMLAMPSFKSVASIPGMPFKPLRWLLDAGVRVAGSSDYPVTGFDVLRAVRAACSRHNARGVAVDPEQRVSLDEALAMYTRSAAHACGALSECGTLEPGKRADLVVVDGDLRDEDAAVRATIVAGDVVHGQIERPPARAIKEVHR